MHVHRLCFSVNYLTTGGRKVAWFFITKNCGAIWANWKLKLQKLRKYAQTGHTECFIFYLIWFINESNIFKIFETRHHSQWASPPELWKLLELTLSLEQRPSGGKKKWIICYSCQATVATALTPALPNSNQKIKFLKISLWSIPYWKKSESFR